MLRVDSQINPNQGHPSFKAVLKLPKNVFNPEQIKVLENKAAKIPVDVVEIKGLEDSLYKTSSNQIGERPTEYMGFRLWATTQDGSGQKQIDSWGCGFSNIYPSGKNKFDLVSSLLDKLATPIEKLKNKISKLSKRKEKLGKEAAPLRENLTQKQTEFEKAETAYTKKMNKINKINSAENKAKEDLNLLKGYLNLKD